MDDYNDDLSSIDDLEDAEEPGCYFTTPEEDNDNNYINIVSFSFEQPSPSPAKENKTNNIDNVIIFKKEKEVRKNPCLFHKFLLTYLPFYL